MPRLFPLFLCALLVVTGRPVAAEVALPDIGESSMTALSRQEADRIGSEIVQRMRRQGRLLEDPQVEAYVQDLGRRLASFSDRAGGAFTFFVVNDRTVNAFALPGGYIGVHTGLILTTEDEGELAAVLAHEIAHVSQQHIARGLEKANEMNLPMTAALIAALLLGAQDAEVGRAAVAATTAGAAQARLNFTRSHEREADRIGMGVLARSGYDPEAMPSFFGRMLEHGRYYPDGLPELLRTHPVTTSRIADARHRLNEYERQGEKQADQLSYRHARARLEALSAEDPAALVDRLEANGAGDESAEPTDRYRLALAHRAAGEPGRALQLLERLSEAYPDRLAFTLARIETALQDGQSERAVAACRPVLELYPEYPPLTLLCARGLIAEGAEQEAIDRLRPLQRGDDTPPAVYRVLAEAEDHRGHEAAGHIALSQYYFAMGEPGTALTQLTIAERSDGLDFYQRSRIEALRQRYQQALDEAG